MFIRYRQKVAAHYQTVVAVYGFCKPRHVILHYVIIISHLCEALMDKVEEVYENDKGGGSLSWFILCCRRLLESLGFGK
jgi:hypothetical protein